MKDLPRSLHLAVLRSQVKPFFQVVADYLKHRHRVASFICLVELGVFGVVIEGFIVLG